MERKAKQREVRRREKEIAFLEERIQFLEGEVAELEKTMGGPDFYANGESCGDTLRKYEALRGEIESLYEQWDQVLVD